MLGQTVFYTLSDFDRSASGALRWQTFPAVVTATHDYGAVSLHVFVPNPSRPVLVRSHVRAGDRGAPGRWSAEAP